MLAIVDLGEGPRMMANVVGRKPGDVRIGAAVRVTFEDRGGVWTPQLELDAPPAGSEGGAREPTHEG